MGRNSRLSNKPFAIVIGLDSINGLRAARTLAYRDIPVIGIAKRPEHYCCRTNVCTEIIYAETENEALIHTLKKLGQRLEQKAVLVPCNDLNVLPISQHRQQLDSWYHIVLSDPQVCELLMHKTNFYSFAQQEGFATPRTFILKCRHDAEHAARALTFPCILKPSVRTEKWERKLKFKVYKLSTPEDFLSLYDRCGKWYNDLIVQEWVEGSDSNLYTCYCYFSANHEPLVTFVTRKLRQWPPETGEGCLGEECRNDIVLQETVRLFKRVGLRGLGYLEMKRDSKSDRYFIIEPNVGRPTSKSAMAEAGGVELLYTMYCDALGWDLPKSRVQKYGSAKWIFFRRDLQSSYYYWCRGQLTVGEWWRSLKGKKVDALFSWIDLGPFIGDWFQVFRSIFRPKTWVSLV